MVPGHASHPTSCSLQPSWSSSIRCFESDRATQGGSADARTSNGQKITDDLATGACNNLVPSTELCTTKCRGDLPPISLPIAFQTGIIQSFV